MDDNKVQSLPMPEGLDLQTSAFHFKDYLRTLWKGRYYIFLSILIFGVGAFVWSKMQVPIYEATATISIDVTPPQISQNQVYPVNYWFEINYYIAEQIRVLQSYRLAQKVVSIFSKDPTFPFNSAPDPAKVFSSCIKVEKQEDSNILNIKMKGTDPQKVALWVNTVVDEYSKLNIQDNLEKSKKILQVINEQLQPIYNKLGESERQLTQFQASQNIYILDDTNKNVVTEQIEKLNKEYAEAKIQRIEIESKMRALNDLKYGKASLDAFPEAYMNETIRKINTTRVDLELQLQDLNKQYKPEHPKIKALTQQLDDLKTSLKKEISTLIASLETEYKIKKTREEELLRNIELLKDEAVKGSKVSLELEKIKENYQQNRMFYEDLLRRSKEMELSSSVSINRIRPIDPAIPPQAPTSPKTKQNTVVGILLGIFLGVSFVFFLDYLDSSIKTPSDVEKHIEQSVLTVVPKYSPEKVKVLKEFYQSLRTAVMFARKTEENQIVLVTSTGPSEGKTTTCYNLAKVLASAGDNVLLIDTDFRRPAVHKTFNMQNYVGVTSFFLGKKEEEGIIQPTNIPNLYVVPTGPLPPNPPEFITRKSFEELLKRLKEKYNWIILDSPPVLSVTDPILLSVLADMTIVVIRYNEIDRKLIKQCINSLKRSGANVIGTIINDVDFERDTTYSYYHYYYYYKGYDEEALKEKGFSKTIKKKRKIIG